MSLLESVRSRLLALPRSEWPLIAEVSEVPLPTVQKVAYGHTPNPRINTVERLDAALTHRTVQHTN